jgi:predicted anti-sigma-YlaC factor YlaD
VNCSEARKALYPTPDRCVLTIEAAGALEHLQECPDCRRYFQDQAEWSRILREKVGSEVAPEPLQQRIAGAVEKLQTGRTARKLWRRRED